MKQRFAFTELSLAGLVRIDRHPIKDHRGEFSRLFCAEELAAIGFSKSIAQINQTETYNKGSVRGMHYQIPPHAEQKIVSCINGQIIDIVIDLRKNSKTFLHWHGEPLCSKTQSSLYIPEGFAHGFQTLTDNCQLLYIHSEYYAPESERVINPFDPALAISWPLEPTEMSERDRNAPLFDHAFNGIDLP